MGAHAYIEPAPLRLQEPAGLEAAAVAGLVRTRHTQRGLAVTLPVLFPSGSHVEIVVREEGDGTCTVTDDGAAAHEVDMAGLPPATLTRVGNQAAAEVGAVFDRHAFFYLQVGMDALPAALTVLAELVRGVVARCFELAAKSAVENARLEMLDRLEHIFTPARVVRGAGVTGASASEYEVDAIVTVGGHGVIFETFSSAPPSVSALVAKMFDIAQLDEPPGRVAVIASREKLGTKLNLVSSVANIIERRAPDRVYEKAAVA